MAVLSKEVSKRPANRRVFEDPDIVALDDSDIEEHPDPLRLHAALGLRKLLVVGARPVSCWW